MKNGVLIFLFLFAISAGFSQTKPVTKAVKDTVKTEVIEVITAFNPKIADASKLNKKPTIKLLKESDKKKLSYSIFSAPVASTFIPKSGVVKGIDVGMRERIYNNFVAAGFGNYTSPYIEAFVHRMTRFQSEFGLSMKYAASFDNVENTLLDSHFSNFSGSVFYKQEERYFDWKVNLAMENNQYNYYGLSSDSFTENTLNAIDEKQQYNAVNLTGEIDFLDAYIDTGALSLNYFTDNFNSNEILLSLKTNFDFPMQFLGNNVENLYLKTEIEHLNGNFDSDYTSGEAFKYAISTIKVNPSYKAIFRGFTLQLAAKLFGSFDTENEATNFLVYPDIHLQKVILKERFNIYTGVTGDLRTNTYQNFSQENPFVAPTLFMTQTAERYKVFLGFNGVLHNDFSFNISVSMSDEEDKPLFIKNNSKSDGISNLYNGVSLKGYEYGNSFNVLYDDVKTTSFLTEVAYDFSRHITFTANFQYDSYTMNTEVAAWNLPSFQSSFRTAYKNSKWYATSTIFYMGERKDAFYSAQFPSNNSTPQNLKAFADVNLNGGYHFSDKFSAFIKLNNIFNNQYERFANFNVQGFQALGGLTYKFDF